MEAYIIAGYRTAVGKAPRGVFRFTRADDLAAEVIRALVASVPNLDKEQRIKTSFLNLFHYISDFLNVDIFFCN